MTPSPTNEPKTAEQWTRQLCDGLNLGKTSRKAIEKTLIAYAHQEGRELVKALKESRKLAALVWAGQAIPADGDRFRYLMDNAIDKWEVRNQ